MDDKNRPAYYHHLLMPLVTLFLGSHEPDQLCVKGTYWAEAPAEDGTGTEVVPIDLDSNWASIKAEEVCYLYEAAMDRQLAESEAAVAADRTLPAPRVSLVWVEDVQPSAQGRVYVCAQAFLLELGDSPAAVAFGLELQERRTYPADYHQTGEVFVHRGEIVVTGAALAWAMSRQLLQYNGEGDRLGTELGDVSRSSHPNTHIGELAGYVAHLGDIPAPLDPQENPVQQAARSRFAKGAVNRHPEGTRAEEDPDVFS
jgi:hypothetical protein